MRLATAVARWAEAHPEVAELGVGVTIAIFILLVSLTQWGATDTGVTRAVSLGVPLSALTVWAYRRRRHREERRERAFLQQRLQLARELHDSVAGHVAIAGVQAAAARRVLDSDRAAAATALERIEESSRAAVGDLRKMLTALRNETASEDPVAPGLSALPQLVEELARSGVSVEVARHGTRATRLPSAVDRAAYRIVQEALTNVLKHGTDGTASVTVDDVGDAIAIRVTNPVAAPRRWVARLGAPSALGSRMGVIGVRERAALLGGRAFVGPTADGRWLVDVTLPVSAPP